MSTDRYTWTAWYADGSGCSERDTDGTEHGWAEVVADRVVCIQLAAIHPDVRSAGIDVPPESIPVFFRRRTIELSLAGAEPGRTTRTVIGYTTPGGPTRLLVCLDSGEITVVTDLAGVDEV